MKPEIEIDFRDVQNPILAVRDCGGRQSAWKCNADDANMQLTIHCECTVYCVMVH